MSFTSQYFNSGQPVIESGFNPLPAFSLIEKNRQAAFLCFGLAGNQTEQCPRPGKGENQFAGVESPAVEVLVQKSFSMKIARKVLGEVASTDASQINPGLNVSDSPDGLPNVENPVFHQKATPRTPESPDTESFRSWLKANMPKHPASQALLERIKNISQDHNA